MREPMSRRGRVRTLTYLAAAFVVMCGVAMRLAGQNLYYKRMAAMSYARAFSQLTESVNKLDSALEKSVYVTTPEMISALCTEIYGESATALQAACELPYADRELEHTTSYLSKVGSYAQALAKSAAENDGYSGDELTTVKKLSEASAELSAQLRELEAQLNEGSLTPEDTRAVEERFARASENGKGSPGAFETLEQEFPELPTLIYDGPFSEHLQSRGAAMLEHERDVTAEEARRRAAEFLERSEADFSIGQEVRGEIPCYTFGYTVAGNPCTVQVTKKGGYILSVSNGRSIGAATISHEAAEEIAEDFLERRSIDNMEDTYSIAQDNSLTINYASEQEDVICYPDLIKVEVALDTGEIVGFESAGYLTNHTQREKAKPIISRQKAEKKVSSELKVLDRELAIIPTEGQNEVLCWEFKCENKDGQHYIVYINAKTGAEQKILILLEDEHGTLVM